MKRKMLGFDGQHLPGTRPASQGAAHNHLGGVHSPLPMTLEEPYSPLGPYHTPRSARRVPPRGGQVFPEPYSGPVHQEQDLLASLRSHRSSSSAVSDDDLNAVPERLSEVSD